MHFSLLRWLRSITRTRGKTIVKKPKKRTPLLELLEDRLNPASFTWTGLGADTNWSTGGNWVGGVAPTASATAVDDLIFAENVAQATSNNDLVVGLNGLAAFNSIAFAGDDYVLTGNQIILGDEGASSSGFINSNVGATNNVIQFDIQMGGNDGGLQFFTISSNSDLTIEGKLSTKTGVDVGLTKDGQGTLTLTGDNKDFLGDIAIQEDGGIIVVSHANALGDTAHGTTVAARSQIQVKDVVGGAIGEDVLLSGSGISNDGPLFNASGDNEWSGDIQIDADMTIGAAANSSLDISGVISELVAGRDFTKVGQGKIILSNTNDYSGVTTIEDGILAIGAAGALGTGDGTAATGTFVVSNAFGIGTLQLDANGNGFTTTNELLTLNDDGFGGIGALDNLKGDNTWAGDIILGSPSPDGADVIINVEGTADDPTSFRVTGIVKDPNGAFDLDKIGEGTLIFVSANTYRGFTDIREGTVEIRDSKGLGTSASPGQGTTVRDGATLKLAVDSIVDSVTATTNKLEVSEILTITGLGLNGVGALYSASGINNYKVDVDMTGTIAGIGVDPDLTPNSDDTYFTDDFSLTFENDFVGDGSLTMAKLGKGHMILSHDNDEFFGFVEIRQGWITIQTVEALGVRIPGIGDTVQPGTTVSEGAALHIKPLNPGESLTIFENLTLSGLGIGSESSNFDQIAQKGALVSLEGVNTLTGDVKLGGEVGIGVQNLHPDDFPGHGQLFMTGQTSQTLASINLDTNFSGNKNEFDKLVKVGSSGAIVDLDYQHHSRADRITVFLGATVTVNGQGKVTSVSDYGTLLYDTQDAFNNSNALDDDDGVFYIKNSGSINIDYTSTGASITHDVFGNDRFGGGILETVSKTISYATPANTDLLIVVNKGGNQLFNTTVWTLSGSIVPTSASGTLVKLGTEQLIIQGDGTYEGGVDIREGIVTAQNDTALGAPGGGPVIVQAGTALELVGSELANNGGISALEDPDNPAAPLQRPGIQVWGKTLILHGTGNADFNADAPLMNLEGDNAWRGNVNLPEDAVLNITEGTRLTISGVISDTVNTTGPSDLIKIGEGELMLAGENTYRGTTFVGTATQPNGIAVSPGGILTVAGSKALGASDISEVQTVAVTGTSGTFALTFNNETTDNLNFGATAAEVEAALNNIASIKDVDGSVTVTKLGNTYTVTFKKALSGFDQETLAEANLTGDLALDIDTTTEGAGGTWVDADATIQLQGNITVAGEPVVIQGDGVDNVPTEFWVRWFDMGPAPINNGNAPGGVSATTGRITGVVVDPSDPNVIYISAAGGGVWKTKNGGQTWEPMMIATSGVIFTGAIAIDETDPRIIYVATGEANNSSDSYAGTGIYKSTDSGKSWTLVTGVSGPNFNPINGRAVSKLVIDPNDNDIIYAAVSDVAENGVSGNAGIWRHDGTRWQKLTGVVSDVRKTDIDTDGDGIDDKIAPRSPGPDDDWRYHFPQTDMTWSDLAFVGGTLFAALGTTLGPTNDKDLNAVYYTTNPDDTLSDVIWYIGDQVTDGQNADNFPTVNTDSNRGDNYNIKVAGSGSTVYAAITRFGGDLFEVRKSTDGGLSWTDNVTPTQAYMGTVGNFASAILARSADTVYVASDDMFLVTTDGGSNWADLGVGDDGNGPHGRFHAMWLDGNGKVLVGTDGGLWRLDDETSGSVTWTDLNGNLSIAQFNSVALSPTNPNIAVGSIEQNGLAYFDGTQDWEYSFGNDGSSVVFDVKDPDAVYAVIDGSLRKSTDGGKTFPTTISGSGIANNVHPFFLDTIDNERFLAGGITLRESVNAGSTWVDLNPPINVNFIAGAVFQGDFFADTNFNLVTDQGANAYDPDTIYIADSNSVYVTKNHGNSWRERTPSTISGSDEIIDMIVDPTNRDTVYLVVKNSSDNVEVYKTTTAGRTVAGVDWVDISDGLPNLPGWSIVLDPRTGDLYLGTDNGVWKLDADDITQTWQQFGTGISNVQVKDLFLDQTNNTLAAGTYGLGMYVYHLPNFQLSPNAGALRSVSGNAIWTGRVILAGDTTISAGGIQTLQNGVSTAVLNLVGSISELNAGATSDLTKIGEGDVILAGANTYAGTTFVDEGVVVIRNAKALGDPGQGTIVADGTALELQSSLALEPLELHGDGFSVNGHNTGALRNVSNSNTYTGPITLASNVTIGVDTGSTLTLTSLASPDNVGTITDGANNFNLTKELTGTLIMKNANSYDGSTFINQGVVRIFDALALGSDLGATQVRDLAQLQLAGNITVENEDVTISGVGTANAGALGNFSGDNTWNGNVTLASVPSFSPTSTPPSNVGIGVTNAGESLTINGIIDETGGTFGLEKLGSGKLILTADNTYGGVTTVSKGTLSLRDGGALGDTSNGTIVKTGSVLELDGDPDALDDSITVVAGETITINGTGISSIGAVHNISGNNTIAGSIVIETSSSIGVDAGTKLTLSGVVKDVTPAPSTFPNLTKTGAGALVFTNTNTYDGKTIVSQGVVQVDGTIKRVELSGGTLSGEGNVGSIVMATGKTGKVDPGDNVEGNHGASAGILTSSGPVTWNSNTTYFVDLNGTVAGSFHDKLIVNGNVTLGNATLTGFVSPFTSVNDTFTIIETTGGGVISGSFAGTNPSGSNPRVGTVFIQGVKFKIEYFTDKVVLTRQLTDVTLNVISSANPSVFGQDIVFTATLEAESGGQGFPDGYFVTFTFGSFGSQDVFVDTATGEATISALDFTGGAPLDIGTHQLTAAFAGDASFTAASDTLDQVVNQAGTVVDLDISEPTPIQGQVLTFTATVTGKIPSTLNPADTGTVTFKVDGSTKPAVTIDENGVATIDVSGLAIGNHTVTAVFNGNTNFAASAIATVNFTVTKANTSTTVTGPANAVFSESVTFTVNVEAILPATGVPGGSVKFIIDGVAQTTSKTLVNGQATLTLTNLTVGAHTIDAQYNGNGTFNGSSTSDSTDQDITVAKAGTTTTVTATAPSSTQGQNVTFTASVVQNGPATVKPTSGTVTFFVDGVSKATVTINATTGKATFSTSTLTAGPHNITAEYNGTANHAKSDNFATPLAHSVVGFTTNTVVTSSVPSPVNDGTAVTFFATVTANGTTNKPTGTVTFVIDGTPQTPINMTSADNGKVSITRTLPAGVHTISAQYGGSGVTFGGSNSADVNFTVNGPASVMTATFDPGTTVAALQGLAVKLKTFNAQGTQITSYNKPVTASITSGPSGGTLSGTTTVSFSNGVANFTGLKFSTAGTYTLHFDSDGIILDVTITVKPPAVRRRRG